MQEGAADARKVFGGGGQHRAVAIVRARPGAPHRRQPPQHITAPTAHSWGTRHAALVPGCPVPSAGVDSARVRHNRQHLNGEPRWRCLSRLGLIRKRRKGELKHARSKHKNKGRKKKKKKKDQVNNKKKQGGQTGKVNACAPVICSREEPPGAPRDLAGLSNLRRLRGEMA